ncbi:MAG: response regulator transcription factor [Anaerolineaceae bacterium]
MSIRILLVGKHPLIGVGIRALFENITDFQLIGEVFNYQEVQSACQKNRPDIVLFDINVIDISIIEIIKLLKFSFPNLKLITLIPESNPIYVKYLVNLKINSCVMKNENSDVLIAAIRKVNQGETFLSNQIIKKISEIDYSDFNLSEREFEVLQLVGEGKTNYQIGMDLNITERTVRSHMESIMQKMCVKNRTEALKKAIQKGWFKV